MDNTETIRIVISYDAAHVRMIATLLTSLRIYKNPDSDYQIFLERMDESAESFLGTWERFCVRRLPNEITADFEKVLYLQWNTLVLGDLSALYATDLQGYECAAVENIPQTILYIPDEIASYHDAVVLAQYAKLPEIRKRIRADEEVQVKAWNPRTIICWDACVSKWKYDPRELKRKLGVRELEPGQILKNALLLCFVQDWSPELYFDTPTGNIWMQAFRKSGYGMESVIRKSSIENFQTTNGTTHPAKRFLIRINEPDVPFAVAKMRALETRCPGEYLEFRILYMTLSEQAKHVLVSLPWNHSAVYLHNIQLLPDADPEELCNRIFAGQPAKWIEPAQLYEENPDVSDFLSGEEMDQRLRLYEMETENRQLKEQLGQMEEELRLQRESRERAEYELRETRASVTYKIGRALTALPRSLRGRG